MPKLIPRLGIYGILGREGRSGGRRSEMRVEATNEILVHWRDTFDGQKIAICSSVWNIVFVLLRNQYEETLKTFCVDLPAERADLRAIQDYPSNI